MVAIIKRLSCLSLLLVWGATGAWCPAQASDQVADELDSWVDSSTWTSFDLTEPAQPEPGTAEADTEEKTILEEEGPGSPFSFSITYCLHSDYIFRGINFSEYAQEGRERLNHQMTTNLGVDVGQLFGLKPGAAGTFGFGTFFEWFAGQKKIDPDQGGQNLQEVDYYLSWAYEIAPAATTLTLGYNFYTLANAKQLNTSEWTLRLDHNDAWMWKWLFPENEDGVLNPSFLFVHDLEYVRGCWMEFGFKHDFAVFENFVLTPNVILAVDHRYLDQFLRTGSEGTTRMAYVQYGLTAAYDLTPVLHMPDWAGSVVVSGFIYLSDPVGTADSDDVIQEEVYGGMSVTWSL